MVRDGAFSHNIDYVMWIFPERNIESFVEILDMTYNKILKQGQTDIQLFLNIFLCTGLFAKMFADFFLQIPVVQLLP